MDELIHPNKKTEGIKMNMEEIRLSFGVTDYEVEDILYRLDVKRWLGGETIDVIKEAGPIDNGDANMIWGHNGYYVTTGDYLNYILDGDPVWCDDIEDNRIVAGII